MSRWHNFGRQNLLRLRPTRRLPGAPIGPLPEV
jgi:hypothetical protein